MRVSAYPNWLEENRPKLLAAIAGGLVNESNRYLYQYTCNYNGRKLVGRDSGRPGRIQGKVRLRWAADCPKQGGYERGERHAERVF